MWIGVIFSTYSVAVIINSPFIGFYIRKFGRRNLMTIGTFFMGTSIISYGLIGYIENKILFISLSIIFRFIQGISSCCI